jgi:ATP-dependent DNA ligase
MVDDDVPLPMPVQVALATTVHVLPVEEGRVYEGKFDGHRIVIVRTAASVLVQTRSGRLTRSFPDLAAAAISLRPGTVLDGEVVLWSPAGRLDFGAVQQRAASTARRAALLQQLHDFATDFTVGGGH